MRHFVDYYFFFLLSSIVADRKSFPLLRINGAWMGNFHHKALMVFALVSAYTAPALMTVCLLTNYWIYGNQTNISSNMMLKPGDPQIVNYTFHRIGLWRECSRESHDMPYRCENAKYSNTAAKSVKGFKAVACKSIELLRISIGNIQIDQHRVWHVLLLLRVS